MVRHIAALELQGRSRHSGKTVESMFAARLRCEGPPQDRERRHYAGRVIWTGHVFSAGLWHGDIMSTRAGLFRAWAVGTVVWVGAISFIGLQAVSQNVAQSNYIFIPGDRDPYQLYTPRPGMDDGRRPQSFPDGSRLYFHWSTRQYDVNLYAVADDFWEQRWIRYWTFIRPWLLLIALPGFLFILVYALMWVFDGFGGTG
jgi:hypothetical protein